mgnify:CR=1 FL=1
MRLVGAGVVGDAAAAGGEAAVPGRLRLGRHIGAGSLGRVDEVLIAEHPFRETGLLADDVQAEAAPLLLTQGSALYRADDGEVRRAAQLQVLGVNEEFWKLAEPPMAPPIERGNQIALTADIAEELGVKVGDAVLLRIPLVESIPADSTLGEKEETAATRRLTVSRTITSTPLLTPPLLSEVIPPQTANIGAGYLLDLRKFIVLDPRLGAGGGSPSDGAAVEGASRG